MTNRMWAVLATGAAMLAGTAAAAQDADGGTRVTAALTGGTLGIGPELGVRLSDHVGVRGGAGFLSVSPTIESDDLTYDGTFRLQSYGAMVDVYPFGGAFRISGGARINRNRVTVGLTPNGQDITVGGEDFTAAQVGRLSGRAAPNRFSPALTLGWGGGNRRGFFFGTELGVLFQGAFKLDTFQATGTARNDPSFQAALEAERRSVQDDVDKVKVWPIVQASIGWRF